MQRASVEHLELVPQYFYDLWENSTPDMEMGTGFSCMRIVTERDPSRPDPGRRPPSTEREGLVGLNYANRDGCFRSGGSEHILVRTGITISFIDEKTMDIILSLCT